MINKSFTILCAFITLANIGQAQQVNSRRSGNFASCFTWINQFLVGNIPAHVVPGTTITLTQNHNTYQSISFADNTSVLELSNNTTLNINDNKGALNMDNCTTTFDSPGWAYSCISLWGTDNLSWPFASSFGDGPSTVNLIIATITTPGFYRIENNTFGMAVTLPVGSSNPRGSGCWGNQFYIEASLMKNNSRIGGPYILQNRTNNVIRDGSFGNCITSSPAVLFLEYNQYKVRGSIDLGYCNTGDVIAVRFTTTRDRASSCTGGTLGVMQGHSTFTINRYL